MSCFVGSGSKRLYSLDPTNTERLFPSLTALVDFYKDADGKWPECPDLGLPLPAGGLSAGPVTEAAHIDTEPIAAGSGEFRVDGWVPFWRSRMMLAVYLSVLYFIVGLVFYTQVMGWRFASAMYFIVVVVTTIGYGDNDEIYCPKWNATGLSTVEASALYFGDNGEPPPCSGEGPMLFTAFFVLVGVGLIFSAMSVVLETYAENSRKAENEKQMRAVAAMLGDDDGDAEDTSINDGLDDTVVEIILPEPKSLCPATVKSCLSSTSSYVTNIWASNLFRSFTWVVVTTAIGMAFACNYREFRCESDSPLCEPLSLAEGFYWCIVTATTVGFGDISPGPGNEEARIFGIFYLLIAVVFMGSFLGNLGNYLRNSVDIEDVLGTALSEDMIAELDKSGDGFVSKDEWLRAILTVLKKVDDELCEIILSHFDALDADGSGTLSADDLKAHLKTSSDDAAANLSSEIAAARVYKKHVANDHFLQIGMRTNFGNKTPSRNPARSRLRSVLANLKSRSLTLTVHPFHLRW